MGVMNNTEPFPVSDNPVVPPAQSSKKSGCGSIFVYFLMFFWNTLVCLAAGQIIWVIEQGNFSGEVTLPNLRWLVMLVAGLLVGGPNLLFSHFIKRPGWHSALRVWAWGGLFMALMTPSYLVFVTDFQATMLLKIAAAGVYLLILLAWNSRHQKAALPNAKNSLWLVLALTGIIGLPWIWVGALGSVIDTLLALILAFIFGLSASLTLELTGVVNNPEITDKSPRWLWLNALTSTTLLGIMVSGIAQSGSQPVLYLCVPLIGLSATAISTIGGASAPGSRRLPLTLLIAAPVFWPLALVDPDELMVVISSSEGDLLPTVLTVSLISMLIVLISGLALLSFQRPIRHTSRKTILAWLPGLLIWAGMVVVYLTLGRPGLYGERLFVILKDQPDVSAARQEPTYNQRRDFVYRTLVSEADRSQSDIRQSLDRLGIKYQPYYLVNALEVDGGPLLKAWLATRPEVDRILASPHLRPLPETLPVSSGNMALTYGHSWNLEMIHADKVWQELDVTGKGVIVGQSDSGVQGDHPELAVAYHGFNGSDDFNWFDPWYHTSKPTDLGGHGTHTLGTILGKNVGVAPGAQWIGCANLARNLGNPALYLDCMQFMLAPFPQNGDPFKDGDSARGAMVLNDSWGCPDVEGCDANVFQPAVKALQSAGVFVVASAGNGGMGGCSTVEDPIALYGEVYSVGAVDIDGDLAEFSSKGPVTADGSGRVKPDIIAPGVDVFSSMPNGTYASNSGTSMAGPHVVGVVALMWSANPHLIGDIERTTRILNETAQPYEGYYPVCVSDQASPNNGVGYGIVDAYAAVKAALAEK